MATSTERNNEYRRSILKCHVCGDIRIDAEVTYDTLREKFRRRGWRFASWGAVCSWCRREAQQNGKSWRDYAP